MIVKELLLFCDNCGYNCGGDDREIKKAIDLRASRKLNGWIYKNGNDYCNICAEKLFGIKDKSI